jgi:hypothetical protein
VKSEVSALAGAADNSAHAPIEVKQLDYDLTPVAGLALVGTTSRPAPV